MLPDEITVNFKFRPRLWLVSPLAALSVFALFFVPWGAESAPAWVQAIGSVAAILVSVQIARSADRRADKARKERNQVHLQVVARLVEDVETDVGSFLSSIGVLAERQEWGQAEKVIASTVDMFNGLDVAQFGDPDVARAYLRIRNDLRSMLNYIHILIRTPGDLPTVWVLEGVCVRICDFARQLLNVIKAGEA